MKNFKILLNGIINENPTFVLLLGMCPTLGTTSSAINGMSMGLATMFVLICSNTVIAAVKNVIPKHLEATSAKLIEAGCIIEEFDEAVRVIAPEKLKHTQVTTLPYPGFPTDMQPQMAVVLGIASGISTVTESIFENRFKYVDELTRMGADIKVEGNVAIINGIDRYTGARVNAPDLRAGAALVIAGLAGEGITVVDDIHFVERGYEALEEKLRGLGAVVDKVSSEKDLQKFILKVS